MPPRFILLATHCALLVALCVPARSTAGPQGPDALRELLARYDKQSPGAVKDLLATEIDAIAHQKYVTVSRLYWYTDLSAAQAAARASGKPILHLRMLGRLDEELSCANSRLFRATLYSNRDVSTFLRDNFVLVWSSERPVPKVTIDYGDGRKIERTTAGNSAHYVMDADGHVLDVLPGLYAPTAFRKELTESLALAASVRGKSDDERAKLVVAYHSAELQQSIDAGTKLVGTPYLPGARILLTQQQVETELQRGQRATMTKAAIEISALRYITAEIAPKGWSEEDVALWASAGQQLYGIGDIKRNEQAQPIVIVRAGGTRITREPLPPPPRVLDESSLALVIRLHDAIIDLRGTPEQRDAMVRRLEQHMVGDTALNQLRLRPMIAEEIVRQGGRVELPQLNAWIYDKVFHTPKADPWLGMLPRTDFTGLAGDGVVMR
jgi:hypothetical protein